MTLHSLMLDSQPYILQYGLLIVLIGALLEGETIILLSGVLCHQGLLPLDKTIMIAAIGAFMGDQFWFYIGHHYGQTTLSRFPKLAKHADKIRPWLKEKSDWIAISSRFIYGTRTISPLLLSMNGYSARRFVMINSISASLWSVLVVGSGYLIGTGVEQLFGQIKHIEQLLLLIVIIMLAWNWRQYRKLNQALNGKK